MYQSLAKYSEILGHNLEEVVNKIDDANHGYNMRKNSSFVDNYICEIVKEKKKFNEEKYKSPPREDFGSDRLSLPFSKVPRRNSLEASNFANMNQSRNEHIFESEHCAEYGHFSKKITDVSENFEKRSQLLVGDKLKKIAGFNYIEIAPCSCCCAAELLVHPNH